MPRKPKHLLGTHLEGGGQLLRLSLGLSALKGIPVHITNIRGNRRGGGGLKLQHLRAVEWLAEASSADIEGAERASKTLTFEPNGKGNIRQDIDIGSPGSVGLVFQAILPYLIFAGGVDRAVDEEIKVRIKGGTNVSLSPSYEYIQHVLLPTLARIGVPKITATLENRGWTHGRLMMGSVLFGVTPLGEGDVLKTWKMVDRGAITKLEAYIIAPQVVQRQAEHDVKVALRDKFSAIDDVEIKFEDSRDPKRFYLLLVAISEHGYRLGRDWLYDKKTNLKDLQSVPGRLVKQVVKELEAEVAHEGCVDGYMTDQLIVFQALAQGKCEIDFGFDENGERTPASLHAQTAHWVAETLLGVEWGNGQCEGHGFVVGGGIAAVTQGRASLAA